MSTYTVGRFGNRGERALWGRSKEWQLGDINKYGGVYIGRDKQFLEGDGATFCSLSLSFSRDRRSRDGI